jgi:hypothetical protein
MIDWAEVAFLRLAVRSHAPGTQPATMAPAEHPIDPAATSANSADPANTSEDTESPDIDDTRLTIVPPALEEIECLDIDDIPYAGNTFVA